MNSSFPIEDFDADWAEAEGQGKVDGFGGSEYRRSLAAAVDAWFIQGAFITGADALKLSGLALLEDALLKFTHEDEARSSRYRAHARSRWESPDERGYNPDTEVRVHELARWLKTDGADLSKFQFALKLNGIKEGVR